MSRSRRNGLRSCLIRFRVREILAIRGLLLVGDFSTTILTGGHALRNINFNCCKCAGGADLWLKETPFGSGMGREWVGNVFQKYIPDPSGFGRNHSRIPAPFFGFLLSCSQWFAPSRPP